MRNSTLALMLGLIGTVVDRVQAADPLTICELQYTANTNGASYYDGQIVDCAGGIVVGKTATTQPRLFLQDPFCAGAALDPEHPDAWCGIQVKDWTWPFALYDNVEIGDWVSLTNVLVEEYVGVTFLQYQASHSPGFTKIPGYGIPDPIFISPADFPAPAHDPQADTWFVADHAAEPYESLRVVIRDVIVGDMDLGKARDNYVLQDTGGNTCWVADYMNDDKPAWEDYHEFVSLGQEFCGVAGLLEQYTRIENGWDYYQLVTLAAAGLAICGDGNVDGDTTIADLERLTVCLTGQICPPGEVCNPPSWSLPPADLPPLHCLMMDVDQDGDVDLHDFAGLQGLLTQEDRPL